MGASDLYNLENIDWPALAMAFHVIFFFLLKVKLNINDWLQE